MWKRTEVIRRVTTPSRQSLANSRKRALRSRTSLQGELTAMAARSVCSRNKSRVIESRKQIHRGGLSSRNTGGSTESAAVSRPLQERRPWWKRLDRDLRAGQMFEWIAWEHGRSSCSLLRTRIKVERVTNRPGIADTSGCNVSKADETAVASSEREAKEALWSRGSLSTLIVLLESWETLPGRSQ